VRQIPKPPHGAPCTNCGLCCQDSLCILGQKIFNKTEGPCPALLKFPNGESGCGVVTAPGIFAPAVVQEYGTEKTSEAASILIGKGMGCDCIAFKHEIYNGEWAARVKKEIARRRKEIDDALRVWDIAKTAR
jgi:hypothetical protein